MSNASPKSDAFRALHRKGAAFIIPNAYDIGSARILEALGFDAIATTSSGFAMTLGRRDYGVTREEAVEHARALAGAVDIPVSADLENGFGLSPDDVALTVREAAQAGAAGGTIEDTSGDADKPIIDRAQAIERIAAAAGEAKKTGFALTARAEGFLHGQNDLGEVIARLVAYEEAGADILFAPGLPDIDAVKEICKAVTKPVNVLIYGALASKTREEYAEIGVARLSLGGGLAYSAYGAMAAIAAKMKETGQFAYPAANDRAMAAIRDALR